MKHGEYEIACRHFLASVPGIGARTAIRMMERHGNAERIWRMTESDILREQNMTDKQKKAFLERKGKWEPQREWMALKEKKINIVTYDESLYPQRLQKITDKPFLLYYKGTLPAEDMPSVAIVGARMCSEYGRRIAEEFAAGLAELNIQVISGMASGIDGLAQKSALEHEGKSYGVLGCGVDICYPPSNRPLYRMLEEKGGILSEYPPGVKPETWHFPVRNRIISGLADLILVVEAKEKSGTRITVNMALEQGKEVYAVPGRITDALSLGCLQMIRDGAGIALKPEEAAEAAFQAWERSYENVRERGERMPKKQKADAGISSDLNGESFELQKRRYEAAGEPENQILSMLETRKMYADEILQCLTTEKDMEIGEVLSCLTELVCRGRIVCRGGVYEML